MFNYKIYDPNSKEPRNERQYVIWGDGNIKRFCGRDRTWSSPVAPLLVELNLNDFDSKVENLETDTVVVKYLWERKEAGDVLESIRESLTEEEYKVLKGAIR
jgi:hypothetical protein